MIPQLELDMAYTKRILVEFLREEITRTGAACTVIGLSGGIDSAISAFLAAEALGKDNVFCVLMPYRTSSPESISDAEAVIASLGCHSELVDISPMVDAFLQIDPQMDKVRKGNLMARTRMIVLYDRSAKHRALVTGTGNKTEILLGYSTLYGDSAYAVNPIGDLYKTQIFELARHLGVPEQIISKPPSADLWQGQSDEDELGFTYELVDRLLYFMVDERKSDTELAALGFDPRFAATIRARMTGQQYKRRMPVIAKVTNRTVNADFRYARDWNT